MNDKQLSAFVATAELGSMNRAAERLYISQPALKKQIDSLEAELGCVLFSRTSAGCSLTHAGSVFLEGAGELLKSMEALSSRTRSSAGRATIKICTLPDIAPQQLDQSIIRFSRAHPDVTVKRVPLPTRSWLKSVRNRTADLCTCFSAAGAEPFKRQGLSYRPSNVFGAACCFMADTHPLAHRSHVALDDLRGYKLFVGTLLYHYTDWKTIAARHGLDSVPSDEAGDRYEMIARCEEGWVCIHPQEFSRALEPLVPVVLDGISVTSGWVYRATASPVVQAFVNEVTRPNGSTETAAP